MNQDIELNLGHLLPPNRATYLQGIPGIQVRYGVEKPYLRHAQEVWLLRIFQRPDAADDIDRVADRILEEAHLAGDNVLPIVCAAFLPSALREVLDKRGISYIDAHRNIHITAPGLLLHLSPGPKRPSVSLGQSVVLGATGTRAVQVLAGQPQRQWTVAALASEADVSMGEAHKVLCSLQNEGLVDAAGRGPQKRRRIRDAGILLEWLGAQPRVRRVYDRLLCSLYARTPLDLCEKVTSMLDAKHISHAFTGAMAASILGSGPTSVPRAVLRVDPDIPLTQIADTLGADITDRGPNIELWSDTGRVGTHQREYHQGTWIAPSVRIYLDLLGERRGKDIATQFREVILAA